VPSRLELGRKKKSHTPVRGVAQRAERQRPFVGRRHGITSLERGTAVNEALKKRGEINDYHSSTPRALYSAGPLNFGSYLDAKRFFANIVFSFVYDKYCSIID
jgi:hypothetical protein